MRIECRLCGESWSVFSWSEVQLIRELDICPASSRNLHSFRGRINGD